MDNRTTRSAGFTLVELLVSIAIIAILASLIFPSIRHFRKHAEKAKCVSHMRAIHGSLSSHLVDKGYWPQLPGLGTEEMITESEYFGFWVKSLAPYGVSQETWLCPSDKVQADHDPDEQTGSYIPTPFDAFAITPFRWNQPWLVERGNLHGKGAHIAMPDGSINPSTRAFGGVR